MRPYTDNVIPASPAMTRTVLAFHRAFSNPWGRQKSMSRGMLMIGAERNPARKEELMAGARARYGHIVKDIVSASLNEAILYVRFARSLERNKFKRAVYLECLMMLRWIRRNDINSWFWIRCALLAQTAIVPRSW